MEYRTRPEEISQEVYPHFFKEDGTPVQTTSQFHLENMWDHVCLVFDEFLACLGVYDELLDEHAREVTFWGVKLHDIAKPDSIVLKYRYLCSKCHRPNGTKRTHCHTCGFKLPLDVMAQNGWHGHDRLGGSEEYLAPVLNVIGISDPLTREEIRKMVRWHSLVHAMLHLHFVTPRAENERKDIGRNNDDLSFDPSGMNCVEVVNRIFEGSSLGVKVGAILLSVADEHGKISDIQGDIITDHQVHDLIVELCESNSWEGMSAELADRFKEPLKNV